MIVIIDYGMGNLGSVQNMFRRIGVPAEVTGDLARIEAAEKLLLPGVGAFDAAMQAIAERGLRPILGRKALKERVPTLGICLGMQLLARGSEEGHLPGLGWIAADVLRFPARDDLKVPHMGWNVVHPVRDSPLTQGLPPDSRFYFVHSYYMHADRRTDVLMTTTYGVEFDAIVHHKNIYGAQFHPEKSHKFGMQLLGSFARL